MSDDATSSRAANHIEAIRRDLGMSDHEYLTLRDAQWCSDALPSRGVRVVVRDILNVRWIVRELEELLHA
jgi:hypothetical protein